MPVIYTGFAGEGQVRRPTTEDSAEKVWGWDRTPDWESRALGSSLCGVVSSQWDFGQVLEPQFLLL